MLRNATKGARAVDAVSAVFEFGSEPFIEPTPHDAAARICAFFSLDKPEA